MPRRTENCFKSRKEVCIKVTDTTKRRLSRLGRLLGWVIQILKMSLQVHVPFNSCLCRILSIDMTSDCQHNDRSKCHIQRIMPTGRRKTIAPNGSLCMFYLCMCCSFPFEECVLFITINEACNPLTIVSSLNLSKHNSQSQSPQFSFIGNETFPRLSQNLFPSHLINCISCLFLEHYSKKQMAAPLLPFAEANGCIGGGEYLKKLYQG